MTNDHDLQKSEDKKVFKKEAVKKTAVKKEAVKKEAVNKEAVNKEVVKKEVVKKEVVKKEVVNKEVVNKEVVKKEVVKKVPKVKKNKDGPKKNLTSYMWFCNLERQNIKTENNGLNSKAVISELASRWQELKKQGVEKLEKFEKMAQDDKDRYIKEKEEFSKKVDVIVEESEVPAVEVPAVEVPAVATEEVKVKKTKKTKK